LRGCGLKAHSQKGIDPKYLGEAPQEKDSPDTRAFIFLVSQ